MSSILTKLNGYKTYIVCASTVVFNLVQAWNGSIDWNIAIKGCQEALMVAAMRHGIAKL